MRYALLFIALLATNVSRAQSSEQITHQNDLNINIGLISTTELLGGISMAFNSLGSDNIYEMSDDPYSIPSINVNYGRQITPLINVGACLSYSQVAESRLLIATQEKIGYDLFASTSLMPTIRFDWHRGDVVRCYSKVGCGVSWYLSKEIYDDAPDLSLRESQFGLSFDVVPIGITAGRKFFGLAELSIGTIGLIKFGGGYRF